MKPTNSNRSIASDERARIPFAVIGVLLLLSSVAIVASLETRQEPESNIDPSLALDRAEASTQSAIKDAMLDASQDAAASPVTEAADDGEWAGLLGSTDTLDDRDAGDEVFRNYVSLLVYTEVQERIDGATHTVRENATAEVSIDPITDRSDAEDAMRQVHFDEGTLEDDLDDGTVRVTVEGIEFEVRQEGETIATRTRTVDAVVATPLFDVHRKTQTYQERLLMNMMEGGGQFTGIGREFAARTYPIVIAKSLLNWKTKDPRRKEAPFKEIVPVDQTEVMVNHANYGVQSKVFGTRDPDWKGPMAAGLLCWIDYEYYINYRGSSDNPILPKPEEVMPSGVDGSGGSGGGGGSGGSGNHETYCGALEDYFETASTISDTVPTVWDLVSGDTYGQDTMQQEEEVRFELFARQATKDILIDHPTEVTYDESGVSEDDREDISQVDTEDQETVGLSQYQLEEIVENVYSMDLRVELVSSSNPSFSTSPPAPGGDGWVATGQTRSYSDRAEEVRIDHEWETHDATDTEPLLFTIHVRDQVEETETQHWLKFNDDGNITGRTSTSDSDTGWATMTVEVYGEFAPDSTIDTPDSDYPSLPVHSGGVQHPFEPPDGGSADPPANFDEAPESTLQEVFGVSSMAGAASELEGSLDGSTNTDSGQVASTLGNPTHVDTVLGPDDVTSTPRSALDSYAEDALDEGQSRISSIDPIIAEQTEFVSGNPHQEALERLKNRHGEVVHGGSVQDPFEAMPDFLWTEALHQHHRTAVSYNEKAVDDHEFGVDQLSEGDGSLSEGLALAENATSRGRPTYDGSINSSDLLGTVSFQVNGSPTYLEFDDLERDEDDLYTIRPRESMAHERDFDGDIEFVAGSGCYDNRVTWFGVPLLPYPGSWYVTASSWRAHAHGEYARFEVTANVSEPSRSQSMSYVRESKPVPMELGGTTDEIGRVKPITIDTWGEFPMIVPAGPSGVGDTDADGEDTSEEWDYHGPEWEEVEDDVDDDGDDLYPADC